MPDCIWTWKYICQQSRQNTWPQVKPRTWSTILFCMHTGQMKFLGVLVSCPDDKQNFLNTSSASSSSSSSLANRNMYGILIKYLPNSKFTYFILKLVLH